MHGEKLSKSSFFYTAVIIGGCTLSVAFASHEESEYFIYINSFDLATLKSFYKTNRFIIYISIVVFSILAIYVLIIYLDCYSSN